MSDIKYDTEKFVNLLEVELAKIAIEKSKQG